MMYVEEKVKPGMQSRVIHMNFYERGRYVAYTMTYGILSSITISNNYCSSAYIQRTPGDRVRWQ